MLAPKSTILLLLLGIACFSQQVSAKRQSKCSEERDLQMDVCASKMGFLGDHSFLVPKNVTTMQGFCAELKGSISCIQSYARDCLQGFTRQLLTSLLKRGKQQYSLICHDDTAKRDFINKMACVEDDEMALFRLSMDASITRFEYIAGRVNPEVRLLALCCSYQIFNRDMDASLDKICGKPVEYKGSTNEFVHKVVGGTAGEFFGLICDQHRSMEECKASSKTSSILDKLEETTNKVKAGKLAPKNKSLVPVLLEILDNSSPN